LLVHWSYAPRNAVAADPTTVSKIVLPVLMLRQNFIERNVLFSLMLIKDIIHFLETVAPPALQESYDNAGLIVGNANWPLTSILCTLDATEAVVLEAKAKGCNLVVAHHPIVFGGLKRINGNNYVERAVIAAIKNDIAIYAIHTNLDNVLHGVNAQIANKLGLKNLSILDAKPAQLMKLQTFVPVSHLAPLQTALFAAGGGQIGHYDECSFYAAGMGSFRAGDGAQPFVGNIGERHLENEYKLELVFPQYRQSAVVKALRAAHPYEEPAFDLLPLANQFSQVGSGVLGSFETPVSATDLLEKLKTAFGLKIIKHTAFLGKNIQKLAICGGSGSFLTKKAIAAGADAFVTADIKYHEFFDADGRLLLVDIGHWESEQFTIELLADLLTEKFPTFAALKSGTQTNPVHYYS
jgi:dinuclear metal center YbgI/SA1388 family protein